MAKGVLKLMESSTKISQTTPRYRLANVLPSFIPKIPTSKVSPHSSKDIPRMSTQICIHPAIGLPDYVLIKAAKHMLTSARLVSVPFSNSIETHWIELSRRFSIHILIAIDIRGHRIS